MRAHHLFIGCSLAAGALALSTALLGPYRFIAVELPAEAATVKPESTAHRARPAPLLGSDGTPQPALPYAVPVDPRERTRVALYATREQAQALEAEVDGAVIWIETGCCDESAVSHALELVDAQNSSRNLPLDAPIFVSGKNLQLAALVVDRLSDVGYMQVFLVTR
jgi:hypothetical protein